MGRVACPCFILRAAGFLQIVPVVQLSYKALGLRLARGETKVRLLLKPQFALQPGALLWSLCVCQPW